MVPDSEIIGDMLKILSETTTHLHTGRKPILFIIDDLKVQLINLFDKAYINFEKLLQQHPESCKAEYLICQERYLSGKELNAKRSKSELDEHFYYLKELFKLELSTIYSLNNCETNILKKLLLPPQKLEPARPSFGLDPKQAEKLGKIIHRLCAEVRLVDPYYNTANDLIKVFSSKDLSKEKVQIHLGCQTNEFKYIFKKLKPYFSKLQKALMMRTHLFFTYEGTPLTDSNLSNSKDEKILSKEKIDKIFQQMQ
jgi:hypothetical protein